jgi:16S rRNA (guanine(966)-N(2))-methyltransferase RsmD
MKRQRAGGAKRSGTSGDEPVVGVRIIGGSMRGRTLQYSGDVRTRPMKDRVREAVFNLLGPAIKGTHAIDLFAGTGALGLEAISRGATRATLIERHLPTLKLIEQNSAALGVAEQVEAVFGDAFLWANKWTAAAGADGSRNVPWTIFCSPPYEFYESRREQMLTLVAELARAAPPESLFAVEADERFDFALLPQAGDWDVRTYPPAVVGIYRK